MPQSASQSSWNHRLIIASMLAIFAILAWWLGSVGLSVWSMNRELKQRQATVLSADASLLAQACQELLRRRAASEPIEPFPRIIADLKPSMVVIEDDHVRIEMGGGFHHLGVMYFAKPKNESTFWRDMKYQLLAPNLYYFEDAPNP